MGSNVTEASQQAVAVLGVTTGVSKVECAKVVSTKWGDVTDEEEVHSDDIGVVVFSGNDGCSLDKENIDGVNSSDDGFVEAMTRSQRRARLHKLSSAKVLNKRPQGRPKLYK